VAFALPTGALPEKAFNVRGTVVRLVLSANRREMLLSGWLKAIVSGTLPSPKGPGESNTFPLRVEKKVDPTEKAPGPAVELKVAVTPVLVIEKGTAVPTAVVSKLYVEAARASATDPSKATVTIVQIIFRFMVVTSEKLGNRDSRP